MAKKERISAQEVLETISGFLELLDGEKLQKLDKLDSLDEISSIKAKQDALEAKLTAVDQKMSEFVKPEDFEQKLKKRDEAFNKAIRGVPTEVKVKNDPVCLAQEDRDMLDGLKSQLDKRNRRFSVFSQIISGNKIWFLYLILTAAFSIGITILVMKNSVNEWAHRAMIAAIDMNDENPIGVYLTCRAEMPGDRKRYKDKVKSMERRAEKILYLESLLTDYVNGEYKVTEYDAREEKGSVVLVHQQNEVRFGELGIFIGDGEGFFKRFMGDRLHSLNPEYPDIPLRRFDDFLCCGKVVGHMKKKS